MSAGNGSAWYAAADRGDASHQRAIARLGSGDRLLTSDHVLVETWTLLRYRLGRPVAERFWAGLAQGVATIEPVGDADLQVALQIGEAWPDQDFSIVDRTSFAVMQRLGITRVASYDDDFSVFRFGPGRKLAFEVLR